MTVLVCPSFSSSARVAEYALAALPVTEMVQSLGEAMVSSVAALHRAAAPRLNTAAILSFGVRTAWEYPNSPWTFATDFSSEGWEASTCVHVCVASALAAVASVGAVDATAMAGASSVIPVAALTTLILMFFMAPPFFSRR